MITRLKSKLVAALLVFALSSQAQKRVFEYQGQPDAQLSRIDESTTLIAGDNSYCVILKDSKRIEFLDLDSNFKIRSRFSNDVASEKYFLSVRSGMMGSRCHNNVYSAYYVNTIPGKKPVNVIVERLIDFNSKTTSEKQVTELQNGDQQIGYFNDVFHRTFLLYVNDKRAELTIYAISAAGEFVRKSYNIAAVIKDRNDSKMDASIYLDGARYMNPAVWSDFVDMRPLTKIYTDKNRLMFLMTDINEAPQLITINLDDYKMSYKNYPYIGFDEIKKKTHFASNAMLKDGKLFMVRSLKEKAEVGIYDFETGSLLRKINISATEQPIFTFSPHHVERQGNRTKADEFYTDIKKYLHDVQLNYTSIAVNKNDIGQYVIELGSYKNLSIHVPTEPSTVVTGAPTRSFAWTYRTFSSAVSRFAVDPVSLENVKGPDVENVKDKIDSFLETREKVDVSTYRFTVLGKYFMCGYNLPEKKFLIQGLPN